MPNYLLAYYGGEPPASKEEGMAHMEKWKTWISDLGEKVINPGTPLTSSHLVKSGQVSKCTDENAMKGFAIVKAETIEEANKIAESDPFLAMNGTIRVSQMMEMK